MKRISAGVVALLLATTLAGCASSAPDRQERQAEYAENTAAFAFSITTKSGREIECIAYRDSLDCDWGHAE
jgi:uncharacterized lipoprotein